MKSKRITKKIAQGIACILLSEHLKQVEVEMREITSMADRFVYSRIPKQILENFEIFKAFFHSYRSVVFDYKNVEDSTTMTFNPILLSKTFPYTNAFRGTANITLSETEYNELYSATHKLSRIIDRNECRILLMTERIYKCWTFDRLQDEFPEAFQILKKQLNKNHHGIN